MRAEQLERLAEYGVSFDVETDLTQPGLAAPPLVLGSIAQYNGTDIVGELLAWRDCLDAFRLLIEDPKRIIIGAFVNFDVLVCAVEWAKLGVDLMPAIWRKYEDHGIFDILHSQALHHIAQGHLAKNRDGSDMRDPITNEPNKRYTLAIVNHQITGESGAKANDKYRKSYHLFHAESRANRLDLLPMEARVYPVDDVRNTHRCALAQSGHMPKVTTHAWVDIEGALDEWDMPSTRCTRCAFTTRRGMPPGEIPPVCWERQRHRNQHSLADQCETAWAMYLGAAWGFQVDHDAVDAVEAEVLAGRAEAAKPLIDLGYLKYKKEKGVIKIGSDKATIARDVAIAYGTTGKCEVCVEGKVFSSKAAATRCRKCRGKCAVEGVTCDECAGFGKKIYGPLINCKACCATGLDLASCPQLERTDPSDKFPEGQITASRDVLNESGSEKLRALADYGEHAKTVDNYIPYLRKSRLCVSCSQHGTPKSPHLDWCVLAKVEPKAVRLAGGWRFVQLVLKPNPLLETDRTSYSDPIQQFPREGGLRSCIVARPGAVLVSCDYNQGELITHGQSCIWIIGWSDLASAIMGGAEPHKKLGASMLGLTYEEFCQRFDGKDKLCKDARQASKPANFGYPGGMGSAKLVQTQRKQGPDTPCENGPVVIEVKEDGTEIRGYKGLRFCILMDGEKQCGVNPDGSSNKVRKWGREGYERDCVPLCRRCLECADRLREAWFKAWREAKPYFRFASDCADNGQPVPEWMLEVWPDLRNWVRVDDKGIIRLQPGEVIQHVSGIVRGGVEFTNASNGWFQSLLARAAKLALRWAQRECTDWTRIVPDDAVPGGKVSAYAGGPSPLYSNRVIVFQHDECLAEIMRQYQRVWNDRTFSFTSHDGSTRLSELMERALQLTCPDLAPKCKAPPALMPRWYKAAEPMYHLINGRKELVEWTPQHADPKKCDLCKAAA